MTNMTGVLINTQYIQCTCRGLKYTCTYSNNDTPSVAPIGKAIPHTTRNSRYVLIGKRRAYVRNS